MILFLLQEMISLLWQPCWLLFTTLPLDVSIALIVFLFFLSFSNFYHMLNELIPVCSKHCCAGTLFIRKMSIKMMHLYFNVWRFRPSVCGNILQEMRFTEKVPYLCLRLMEKRIRWDCDVGYLTVTFLSGQQDWLPINVLPRFTVRIYVYLPNFSWTTKPCTMTWSLFCSMWWRRLITQAAIWWDTSPR